MKRKKSRKTRLNENAEAMLKLLKEINVAFFIGVNKKELQETISKSRPLIYKIEGWK